MKAYQTQSSLIRRINQTLLKYVEYSVVQLADGKFTAKFVCLSDLEKKAVEKEGFIMQ